MNLMVVQYGSEAIVVDCGIMFSDHHLPGIDLIVPYFSYLLEPQINFSAIVLTHGHEDHIGAVPFLLRERNVPIYGSRFTLALVKEKLREHELLRDAELELVKDGDQVTIGPFRIEFVRMSHSIADAMGLAIETPEGTIFHTGDFKIDPKPADGRTTDLERIGVLGKKGVLLLLSDSTNVDVPGTSLSESSVRQDLEKLIGDAPGWVIVACFASHIPRLKQVTEIALASDKKVLLAGRSMIQNVGIGRELAGHEQPAIGLDHVAIGGDRLGCVRDHVEDDAVHRASLLRRLGQA